MRSVRSIRLAEREHFPEAPDAPPGTCTWCALPIDLVDPDDYRRAQRNWHRGDEHEVGDRDCLTEYKDTGPANAREAVRRRERAEHGLVACRECGVVCENIDPMDGRGTTPWEADHIVALEDGGEHVLENVQPLCVPCHRRKSAREATARAKRRREARQLALQTNL